MSQVQTATAENTNQAQAAQTDVKPAETPAAPTSLITQGVEETKPDTSTEPKKDEPVSQADNQKPFELVPPKDSILDKSKLDEIASFAKERGLSQEQAQAVLERENNSALSLRSQMAKEIENTTRVQWPKEVQSDQEIGGAQFKESVELAHRVIKDFGTPELEELLSKTGIGNHKELVRVFSRIGKAYADDKFVQPGAMSATKKSAADMLYGGNQ